MMAPPSELFKLGLKSKRVGVSLAWSAIGAGVGGVIAIMASLPPASIQLGAGLGALVFGGASYLTQVSMRTLKGQDLNDALDDLSILLREGKLTPEQYAELVVDAMKRHRP